MLKLDIAGKTLTYKNAPELPLKVGEALRETQERRQSLEKDLRLVRSQERQLRVTQERD